MGFFIVFFDYKRFMKNFYAFFPVSPLRLSRGRASVPGGITGGMCAARRGAAYITVGIFKRKAVEEKLGFASFCKTLGLCVR